MTFEKTPPQNAVVSGHILEGILLAKKTAVKERAAFFSFGNRIGIPGIKKPINLPELRGVLLLRGWN